MKTLSTLLAVLLMATPAFADRRDHDRNKDRVKTVRDGSKLKVYRDDDGDGHYNKKKEIDLRHSKRHSNSRYYYGSRSYYHNHRPYYFWRPRPTVSVTYVRRPVVVREVRSLEADVQRALRNEGYYYGAIDGDIGPGSREAIRNYQYDHSLKVTGRIDSTLLRSLGI